MRVTKKERQEAIEELRKILKPGDTVCTVIRNVSRSGMYRAIDCYKIAGVKDGDPDLFWLSYLIAKATGFRFDEKREAVGVGGCGMDMGFHIVSTLGRVLFPDWKREPPNKFGGNSPDYSLKHRWIG